MKAMRSVLLLCVLAGVLSVLPARAQEDEGGRTTALDLAGVSGIEYDPSFLNFGRVVVGESATLPLTITNTNTSGSLTIGTIRVVDFNEDPVSDSGFSVDNAGDFELASGESRTINVSFEPTEISYYNYRLQIDECSDGCYEYISLFGVGLWDVDPEELDFGEVTIGFPETLPVTITNPSSESIIFDDIYLYQGGETFKQGSVGEGVEDFSVDVVPPLEVAPGDSQVVNVTFDPSQTGEQTAELFIGVGSLELGSSVLLEGIGVPPVPDINVAPTSLNFGTVFVGEDVVRELEIENNGDVPLEVTDFDLDGPDAGAFDALAPSSVTIQPGDAFNLLIRFTPASADVQTADLRILSDDPDTPEVVVPLTGNGALLELAPELVDFGPVPVGGDATSQVVLANPGSTPLQVESLSITGPAASSYSVAVPAKQEGTGFDLPPGQEQAVDVTFAPGSAGSHPATLVIRTDGGNVEVPLAGEGTAPVMVVSDEALDFGEVAVGGATTGSFDIANEGQADLSITEMTVEGTAFEIIDGGAPVVIAPGVMHPVTIRFSPSQPGPAEGTLRIQGNDPDQPEATVALSGIGVQGLAVEPPALDFGAVRVTEQASLELSLTNETSQNVTVTLIEVDGGTGFQVVESAPLEVPAGSSATLTVTFQPQERGLQEATLRLELDDPLADPLTVALTGEGIAPQVAVDPAALDFGMITEGRAAEQDVVLNNTGNTTLNVSGVAITGAGAGAFEVAGVDGPFALEPEDTRTFTVRFQPTGTGSFSATLRFSTDDPAMPEMDVPLSGQALAIQNDTPVMGDAETPVGAAFTVPSDLQGGTGQLFYRMGGSTTYQSIPLQQQGGTLQAMIPASALTIRGVQYYATFTVGNETLSVPAQDPAGSPLQVRVRTPEMQAPGTLTPEAYQMVSTPLELDDPSANGVFADDFGAWDPNQWRLLSWNASSESYDEFMGSGVSLTPGRSFWLSTRTATTFDVGGGLSTDLSAPIVLSLPPGWSQIATPFAFPVAWSSVQGQGQVQGPYAYDGQQYVPGQSTLQPWQGYFALNPSSQPVQLRVSPVTAEAASKDEAPLFADEAYVLQLGATVPELGLHDVHNYLGFAAQARQRHLELNLPEPPAVGSHLRLSIMDRSTPMVSRFRALDGEGGQWDVELSAVTDASHTGPLDVHVTLSARGDLPDEYTVRVVDLDDGRELSPDAFTLTLPSPDAVRHLRVLVGTEAYAASELVPEEFRLEGNYPNPFNPETVISYALSQPERVELVVYNALGQRVRTLVARAQEAGRYEVRWDGLDDAGQQVPSGIYIYRLQAGSFTAARTMLLLR